MSSKGPGKKAAKRTVVPAPASKKAVAAKKAMTTAKKAAPARKPAASRTRTTARKAAPARKPAAGRTVTPAPSARKPAPKRKLATPPLVERHDGPDPEGFFVARVRGEDAVRDAPHQMQEPGGWEEEPASPPLHDEGLGELPWTYGDDLLVALPRDPRTLFVYWDHARATLEAAFAHQAGARVQLWVFAHAAGWDRVRVVDVALEARGWYVHDLEPGRAYRAELHVIGADGKDRLLPGPSAGTALPPQGPSPVIDDRYATLPWEVPLPKLVGPGIPGGPFSEEARALLATLSGWSRFGHSRADGSTGSLPGGPSSPSRPSSPPGPFGGEGM